MPKKSTKENNKINNSVESVKPLEDDSKTIDLESNDENLEVESTPIAGNTANELLNLLRESSGLKAKEIASKLKIDKTDVNKLLYGNLNGQVRYNNSYEWYIRDSSDSSIEINEVKKKSW